MKPARIVTMVVLFAALAARAQPALVRAALDTGGRQFFYAGDPIPITVSLPPGSGAAPSEAWRGLEGATATGEPLQKEAQDASAAAADPRVVDLAQLFPQMRQVGRFVVRFRSGSAASPDVEIRTIPKIDPSRAYAARFETDAGAFTIGLFVRTAPVAAKVFVDLCNAGFYDGTTFHKVVADYLIEGGDVRGDGSGEPPFRFPAELTNAPISAGTVLLKPASAAPPSNGSQFLVLLHPEESWKGQATVLGQVLEGLDVVRKISRLPSTLQNETPHYRPLETVRIRSVTVRDLPPSDAARRPPEAPYDFAQTR